MATMGTEWIYDKAKIVERLKEAKGRITVACKLLEVDYSTLKKVIDKEPELEEVLKNLRNNFESTILDMAENTVMRAMRRAEDDPNNALKSAMFTLNSRGKAKGWDNTMNQRNVPGNDSELSKFGQFIDRIEELTKENEELKKNKSK